MKVLIEGWISYPHSYAIVNVYQIIALSKIPGVQVYLHESPPYKESWTKIENLTDILLTDAEQKILDLLPRVRKHSYPDDIDIVYRINYPYDTSSGPVNRMGERIPVFIFYTAEFGILRDDMFLQSKSVFLSKCRSAELLPLTPSSWSAKALIREKFQPLVVSHGVDITKYKRYTGEEKVRIVEKTRGDLLIPQSAFVFLTVGAMTENKGIGNIIKNFYRMGLLRDDVYLVLKGVGELYSCEKNLNTVVKTLKRQGVISTKHWKKVLPRIVFIDQLYGYSDLCNLYNSCDCYVSPYLAEGFNIPVLEAMACGLPIICSKGGSTDDFTDKSFTLYPLTIPMSLPRGDQFLLTNDTSLQETMLQMICDTHFREEASILAAEHVKKFYTWERIADQMVSAGEYILSGKGTGLQMRC